MITVKLTSRRLVSEILQSDRYRLLFLIHERRKINMGEGAKSRLKTAFGYASDSAFYNDLKFFKDEGLVEESGDSMIITRKGRREMLVVTAPLLSGGVSILYALIFLLNRWTLGPASNPYVAALSPWLTTFLPFATIAFFNFYVYLILRPKLSPEERNFR